MFKQQVEMFLFRKEGSLKHPKSPCSRDLVNSFALSYVVLHLGISFVILSLQTSSVCVETS